MAKHRVSKQYDDDPAMSWQERRTLSNRTKRELVQSQRPFVVWDGEGTTAGEGKPQDYSLFGAFDGIEHHAITSKRLTTTECLEHIFAVGRIHPTAIHVSFAFGYDVTMILRNLAKEHFDILIERGYVIYNRIRIQFLNFKWLHLSRRLPNGTTENVRIFDIWGFFQSSFLDAINKNLKDHPLMDDLAIVEAGKENRSVFAWKDIAKITEYWEIENRLLYALVGKLRGYLYDAGLKISSWHGPGAIATYVYNQHGMAGHKSELPPHINDLCRYAYSGGRFEHFHVGRFAGKIYGIDINSAYPNAISRLPSLAGGEWRHVEAPQILVPFGIYRVRMYGALNAKLPSPLFLRGEHHEVSYPWRLEGWYWSPEVEHVQSDYVRNNCRPGWEPEIIEGWEFHPATDELPFAWVVEMYEERRELKRLGIGTEMAYKLTLNSLYGKMAQRAGWERNGKAPTWHQLDWAGWVTSYTRAMLYSKMILMEYSQLIAVETDAIYTTADPASLGIYDSKELGGWEQTEYTEMVYLQSGIYAKNDGAEWTTKYRGLDRGQLTAESMVNHCKLLKPRMKEWPKLVGESTRFCGFRNAVFRGGDDFRKLMGVWLTETKEIELARSGKRVHFIGICDICRLGGEESAYDKPHEMCSIIYPRGTFLDNDRIPFSTQHDIPWLKDHDNDEWHLLKEWDANSYAE